VPREFISPQAAAATAWQRRSATLLHIHS